MTRPAPRRPRSRTALLLALSLSAVACADGGAGCDGGFSCGGTYAYPQSTLSNGIAPVDDSVRFRLTQAGLEFLQTRLPDLLGGLSDTLTPDPANPAFLRIDVTDPVVLRDSSPRIALGQDVDGMWSRPTTFWLRRAPIVDELRFQLYEAEDAVGARIDDLVIGLDARAYVTTLGGEAACNLRGTSSVVCPPEATDGCADVGLLTTLSFDVLVTPSISSGPACDFPAMGPCFKLDVSVSNVVLGDFNSSSIEVDPAKSCVTNPGDPDCDGECSDASPGDSDGDLECRLTCGAADFILDAAAGLAGAIEGALGGFLDGMINDSLGEALGDIDGMPAVASSRLGLASLLSGFGEHALDLGYEIAPSERAFDVHCVAGTDCREAVGMDIILRTGFEAAPDVAPGDGTPPHPCVVALDQAGFTALYGVPEFGAPLDVPLTGEHEGVPYHLGLSVARGGVNQALYATYNSGVLCLDIDSEAIHALTGGAFPLSAGTINTLSGGQLALFTPSSSPALVTVAPSKPPVASFGAGDESEGHLKLRWQDVRVSFHVLMWERYARVFAVDVDLDVELSAVYDDSAQVLELSVARGPTLSGYEEVYGELLPRVAFAEVLESLLGSLLDQFLGDQLSFELSLGLDELLADATEAPIGVEVRGIETNASRERFNMYFALTEANVEPLLRPAIGDVVVSSLAQGTLTLRGAYRVIDEGLEVLVRVDGGVSHGPFASEGGAITFTHPRLLLPGSHEVEVRARPAGSYGPFTLVSTLVDVPAAHESAPVTQPRVRLVRDGDLVHALLAGGAHEVAWAKDGVWGDFGAETTLSLAALEGVRKLSVMSRDENGQLSKPFTVDLATRAWRLE